MKKNLGNLIVLMCAFLMTVSSVSAFVPDVSIETLDATCSVPQTVFHLGDTVCAKATVNVNPEVLSSHFAWADPDFLIQEEGPVLTVDGQTDTFVIPPTGPNAKLGTWTANIIGADGTGKASANFKVVSCIDTDSGLNTNTGGHVDSFFDIFVELHDTCLDSTHIQEAVCDGDEAELTESILCDGSCMDIDGDDFCVPQNNDVPEFTAIGASFAIAGIGAYLYKRRKK